MKKAALLAALAAVLVTQPVFADPPGQGNRPTPETTLEGRAILPAERAPQGTTFDCPEDPAPRLGFPEPQPRGGYSALLDAGEKDTYWAMPDNGYGAKDNSCQFVLRVDLVEVDYLTEKDGSDEVEVLESVRLRDPDGKIPFPIFTEGTEERLLTGWDFDPESMRIAKDGTWWFGDEFGPFLLHTDDTGRVLEAPIPLPGVKAPQDPTRPEQPVNLRSSSGFEGMAISRNGKYLYPSLERSLDGDDPRRHRIYEFDVRAGEYTGRTWSYRADAPAPPEQEHVIGDMTALDGNRLLVIERDFLQGEKAQFDKVFVVDLRREDEEGFLVKREVVDLLDIRDPEKLSLQGPVRPGDFGLGDPFEFPYITTESVLPVGGNRLAVVNDNNFGGVGGRNPSLPDYTDFVLLKVDGLRGVVEKGDD